MVDELEGLKQNVMDFSVNPDRKIILDDQVYSEDYAKQKILYNLKRFQGFTGGGYFTLGKSLLSTLFSNFATYLVILIQFKLTESSKDRYTLFRKLTAWNHLSFLLLFGL